jgi:PD-(D/E)XK nuclease superfamily
MNKLTLKIDATALGKSACILNFFRTIAGDLNTDGTVSGGYRESAMPAKIVYGVALHKFIDSMYKFGRTIGEGAFPIALREAIKLFNMPKIPDEKKAFLNDEKHLRSVCYFIWTEYIPSETFSVFEFNGIPATEQTFEIKYYEDDFIIVYLCGTIDRIGQIKGGCYLIDDWKSTSANPYNYFDRYLLSRQLRIYRLACKLMHQSNPESTLGRIGGTTMGCRITAIFLEARANDTKIESSDVFIYKKDELDAFEYTLQLKLKWLSQCVQNKSFPKEGILNDSCEKRYTDNVSFGCNFAKICAHNDDVGKVLLKKMFTQRPYEPLFHNE